MKKFIPLFLLVLLTACTKDNELRGYVKDSPDGETYLVVEDDNGGLCGPLILDGKNWPHPKGVKGLVTPGKHTLECGGSIVFTVNKGTTYHVDYWGP